MESQLMHSSEGTHRLAEPAGPPSFAVGKRLKPPKLLVFPQLKTGLELVEPNKARNLLTNLLAASS